MKSWQYIIEKAHNDYVLNIDEIKLLEEAHSGDDAVVLVSHNFAIRTMIHKILGLPLANFHRLSLSLGSICTVEYTARGRRLACYNSTGHLSPENR